MNASSCHPSQLSLFHFFRDTSHAVTVNVLDLLRLSAHAKARRRSSVGLCRASEAACTVRLWCDLAFIIASSLNISARQKTGSVWPWPSSSFLHKLLVVLLFYPPSQLFHHPTLLFSALQPDHKKKQKKTHKKNPTKKTPQKKTWWHLIKRLDDLLAQRTDTPAGARWSLVMMKLHLRLIGRENKTSVKMDQHVLTGEPDFMRRCLTS